MKDLVFIASGGRTGTNLFGNRLKDVIADCWSQHEPDNFVLKKGHPTHRRIADFGLAHMTIGKLRSGLRVIGTRYQNTGDKEAAIASLRAIRSKYHQRRPESLIVESYSQWWMVSDILQEIWPGARMVGVVRDPRAWVASWLAHDPKRRKGWEPMARSVRCEGWGTMSQVERLAWEWTRITETLLAARGDNHRVYRFEDLMHAPDTLALGDMVGFVANGREVGDVESLRGKRVNSSAAAKGAVYDSELLEAVDRHAGGLMERLGYVRGETAAVAGYDTGAITR